MTGRRGRCGVAWWGHCAWVGLVASIVGACGPTVVGDACLLVPGDLVITELMVDPIGHPDTGREWIEVVNVSVRAQVLNRMVIVREDLRSGGEPELRRHHVRLAGVLEPGAYYVLGDGDPADGIIDYSYDAEFNPLGLGDNGDNLSDLNNVTTTFPASRIALECGGRVIDQVRYGAWPEDDGAGALAPEVGRSIFFHGGMAPDARHNDRPELWCAGGEPYDADGNLGSPGAPNLPCGWVRCQEDGVFRDGVLPAPGELLVTEVLLDPAGSSDTHRYWIELFVKANHPVDLNGLAITTQASDEAPVRAVVDDVRCLVAQPGAYVVIGAAADSALNGGLAVDAVAPGLAFSTRFKNGGGTVVVSRYDGATHAHLEIDRAALPPRSANASGRTLMFDGPAVDFTAASSRNDHPMAFCYAPDDALGAFDGVGTPKAPNAPCGTVVCDDGGSARLVTTPTAGSVIVTEIYPNPLGSDRSKEWVEVYVVDGPIDLNGLQVHSAKVDEGTPVPRVRSTSGGTTQCVAAETGDTRVVGIVYEGDAHAHAADAGVEMGGVVPDMVLTTSLTTGFLVNVDSSASESPRLRVELWWGDLRLDAAEVWGPPEGVTASLQPGFYNEGQNDHPEAWCTPLVTGVFEGRGSPGHENLCEAACMAGAALRPVLWPRPGEIVITEVMGDPSGADNHRDWVEIFSTAATPFDLNGLTLTSASTTSSSVRAWTLSSSGCVSLEPDTYGVLAGGNAVDDGVLPTLIFAGGSGTLLLSGEMVVSLRAGEALLDATAPLDPRSGVSWALDPHAPGHPWEANDQVAFWCAPEASGAGYRERGSPGAANEACP